jgi:DNA-binding CsgD family transcriptional regulator
MSLGRRWSEALVGRRHGMGARDVEEAASLEEARVRAHVSGPRALCMLAADLPETGPDAGSHGGDPGRGLELLPTLRTESRPVTVVLTSVTDPAVVASAFLAGVEEAVGELSARGRDILRLVADGHTNEEIGEKVDLSALTVKSHLARVARTPGTGDRAHMVAPGIRSGVIN